MKIKFIALGLILFTFFGCCKDCKKELKEANDALENCNKELKAINLYKKKIESDLIMFDNKNLCESNESVFKTKSQYKHKKKYAKLTLKIPKGFPDPNRTINGNIITYTTKGGLFNKKPRQFKDRVTFSQEYQEIIVVLNIEYDENNECPDILGRKKKTSVIGGTHPLIPEDKDNK
ncbi:hypothetical protein GCM10023311_22020 [Flaviramulus aquimarinus]|uniref:Lipoprotein n=1 Tax=Flaviramulus aquimarinus TaxID=1170456 RepID=A0ABP9FB64_9FLAO